jgi:cell division protein FtsW (lipid II flippase)
MRIDNLIYESWKFLIVLFLVSIFVLLLDKSFKKSENKHFYWKIIVASIISFSLSFLYSDLSKVIVSGVLILAYCFWYYAKVEKRILYPLICTFGICTIGLGYNILPITVALGVFLVSIIINRRKL